MTSQPHGSKGGSSLGEEEVGAAACILKEADFCNFGRKVLFFQFVFTIASACYIAFRGNELHGFTCVAIGQLWFLLLLWCANLPRRHTGANWCHVLFLWERLFSALLILSIPLILSVLQTIRLVRWGSTMKNLFWNLAYKLITIGIASIALITLEFMRLCIHKIYNNKKRVRNRNLEQLLLQNVAIECIGAILKAGVVQTALLTVSLVGYKAYTIKQIYASLAELCYEQGNCYYRYYGVLDGHDEAKYIYEGFVMGLQATLIGFVINLALMQWLATKYISKVEMQHVVQGKVSFRNHATSILLLVIFASVAAITALDPSYVGLALWEYNDFQLLLTFGVCVPGGLLILLLLYYCWSKSRQTLHEEEEDEDDTASLIPNAAGAVSLSSETTTSSDSVASLVKDPEMNA